MVDKRKKEKKTGKEVIDVPETVAKSLSKRRTTGESSSLSHELKAVERKGKSAKEEEEKKEKGYTRLIQTIRLVHFVNRDSLGLANDFLSGFIPEDVDIQSVSDALRTSFGNGTRRSQDFQAIMNQLYDVMYEFNFSLPPDYALVIRALGSFEGTAKALDPEFKRSSIRSNFIDLIGSRAADIFLQEEISDCMFDDIIYPKGCQNLRFVRIHGKAVLTRVLNGIQYLGQAVKLAPDVWAAMLIRMALKPEAVRYTIDDRLTVSSAARKMLPLRSLVTKTLKPVASSTFSFRPRLDPKAPTITGHTIAGDMHRLSRLCRRWVCNATFPDEPTATTPSRLPSRQQPPWFLVARDPELFRDIGSSYCFYSLVEDRIIEISRNEVGPDVEPRVVGSSHGWLACVNPLDCDFYLTNPIRGRVLRLPPVSTLPCMVAEPGLFCSRTPKEWSRLIIKKVITSSGEDNCTVMIIDGHSQSLAFCRPGDITWTALDGPLEQFDQIAYSAQQNLFYALTNNLSFEAWDLGDSGFACQIRHPIVEEIMVENPFNPHEGKSEEWITKCEVDSDFLFYLVVDPSSGDLLYLMRYYSFVRKDGSFNSEDRHYRFPLGVPTKTFNFQVFRLKLGGETAIGEHLKCIGDRALFIGLNHSFCLSARDFPQLRPNSVYFTDDIPRLPSDRPDSVVFFRHFYSGEDIGVFNLEDDTVTPCHHPGYKNTFMSTTVWFTPNPL
ncbi:hypothetical protein RJ639_023784 [Escallonia herrerae]|uniref:KIB1-4 beta-propeller domain-containing protein n=1 Tax=Escallonia herrerae TaxID=1293975 RepID=A0AA88V1U3_9ASTE|nr:hypothetical protein RJ639_023784 [Escallonia herrerae]